MTHTNLVSKRVFVTLPDSIYEDLERWAESQGRPTANLAAFIIETAVREAKSRNELSEKSTVEQGRKE